MKSNRRKFIEKACLAGACFCGFSSLAAKAANSYIPNKMDVIQFIGEKWDWKINYNPDSGIIIVDENKTQSVCPMVNKENGVRLSILCYCSEGFAEKMFSKVIGKTVKATVVSSIQRGDKSCKYMIELPI